MNKNNLSKTISLNWSKPLKAIFILALIGISLTSIELLTQEEPETEVELAQ